MDGVAEAVHEREPIAKRAVGERPSVRQRDRHDGGSADCAYERVVLRRTAAEHVIETGAQRKYRQNHRHDDRKVPAHQRLRDEQDREPQRRTEARPPPEAKERGRGGRDPLKRQYLQMPDVMDAEEQESPEDAAPERRDLRAHPLAHEPRRPDARQVVREHDQQVMAHPRVLRHEPDRRVDNRERHHRIAEHDGMRVGKEGIAGEEVPRIVEERSRYPLQRPTHQGRIAFGYREARRVRERKEPAGEQQRQREIDPVHQDVPSHRFHSVE